jgi:hypothetical protein
MQTKASRIRNQAEIEALLKLLPPEDLPFLKKKATTYGYCGGSTDEVTQSLLIDYIKRQLTRGIENNSGRGNNNA